jgi:hypothetical protein
VVGDRLGVVAGGHGDDALRPFAVADLEQLVERAPLLERGHELQILELHDHAAAQHLRQGA